MRTSVISDIHIDVNKDYAVIDELIAYHERNNITTLLLAGDISSSPELTRRTIAEIRKKSNISAYYVPGNHDLWKEERALTKTDDIYRDFCEDENCLCDKSVVIGNHIVVGDVAWFDYSFGNQQQYTQEDFAKMSKNARTWQDARFNDWTKNNIQKSEYFIEKLAKQIQTCKKEYPDKQVVVMTHMISHTMFRVPETIADWSYFNAFLGSTKLQDLFESNQVAYAICGHVHYRHTEKQNGVIWMCRCLNYHTEWQGNQDIRRQIEDAIEVIEL